MSTGCEFFAEAIVERATGRLRGGDAARLESHLIECSDCRATLEVVRAVRAAPLELPDGLEGRVRVAVSEGVAAKGPTLVPDPQPGGPGEGIGPNRPRRPGWRPWALPLAAAAALALVWVGATELVGPDADEAGDLEVAASQYDPYGAWPGMDGVVAGEPVLSQLSVEELEALLEEMDS